MDHAAALPRAVAFVALLISTVALERAWGRRVGVRQTRGALTDQLMIMGTLAALVSGVVGSLLVQPGAAMPGWSSLLLGAALGIGGLVVRSVAMRSLGRSYTLTPHVEADQQLVTTGPYRVVRHPGYTGILLGVLGLQVLAGTWLALASMLFVVLPMPVRIQVEEQMLCDRFGAEYTTYRGRTRFSLLPGVF